jgi:hypothetical protein
MKISVYRIILFSVFFIFINNNIFAQCIPNLSIVNTGVFPTVLPAAQVGVAYAQVLQFHVAKDTVVTIPIIGSTKAKIDSFTIVKVNGIPNGMGFKCNTSNCTIPGGGNGCADITGIPIQKGIFPLQIILKIKASVGILGSREIIDTLTQYSVTVGSGVSINNANQIENFEYKIFPNPIINNQFNLTFWNKNSTHCSVKIFNIQGALVALELINLNAGFNQQNIQLEGVSKGIYLLQIENETTQFHQKIMVE